MSLGEHLPSKCLCVKKIASRPSEVISDFISPPAFREAVFKLSSVSLAHANLQRGENEKS